MKLPHPGREQVSFVNQMQAMCRTSYNTPSAHFASPPPCPRAEGFAKGDRAMKQALAHPMTPNTWSIPCIPRSLGSTCATLRFELSLSSLVSLRSKAKFVQSFALTHYSNDLTTNCLILQSLLPAATVTHQSVHDELSESGKPQSD